MGDTWKLKLAGILNILAGVVGLSVFGLVNNRKDWPDFSIFIIVPALLIIFSSIFAFRGKRLDLAMAGSLLTTLFFPPLGIPSTILILQYRENWERGFGCSSTVFIILAAIWTLIWLFGLGLSFVLA
jgi:hypothetical protein